MVSMRFVDGVDLATLIRQEGRLEPTRAVRLVEQIASALDEAHGRGIVHRDVKPANVLVAGAGPEEHAYVTDFGIAKRHGVETGLTKTGLVVGTLDYLPPEAFRGEPVGPPGDVYALGCVLYQMLVGDVPFPRATEAGKIAAHLHQPAPLVADRVRGVPRHSIRSFPELSPSTRASASRPPGCWRSGLAQRSGGACPKPKSTDRRAVAARFVPPTAFRCSPRR
jgi:serine/threonine-protein kinase